VNRITLVLQEKPLDNLLSLNHRLISQLGDEGRTDAFPYRANAVSSDLVYVAEEKFAEGERERVYATRVELALKP
jgi:hypothetical protein